MSPSARHLARSIPKRASLSLVIYALVAAVVPTSALAQADLTDSAFTQPWERINPIRPTHPDNAFMGSAGQLLLEAGYTPYFFEDQPTLHALSILGHIGIIDMVEGRVGLDVLNLRNGDLGLGDLTLGLKGGFLGGWDDALALAGIVDLRMPIGAEQFGLGDGVGTFVGMVGTLVVGGSVQLDLQSGAWAHLFASQISLTLPTSLSASWLFADRFLLMGDAVVEFNVTNLSNTATSIYSGLGFLVAPYLQVDAGVRIGLSQNLPDAALTVGLGYMTQPLWN